MDVTYNVTYSLCNKKLSLFSLKPHISYLSFKSERKPLRLPV